MKGCAQPPRLTHSYAVFPFWSLVFVDVEKLCYFIEIIVLLPIFDDLKGRKNELEPTCTMKRQRCKAVHSHQQWDELLRTCVKLTSVTTALTAATPIQESET